MLYTMTLLVCMSHIPHAECTRDTATDVIAGPERTSAAMCSPIAQQYMAQTVLLPPGRYLKVICVPSGKPM